MGEERYEVWLGGRQERTFDWLHDARDMFNLAACSACLVDGGGDRQHCAVYDRMLDQFVRVIRIGSGNDIVFATYAAPCEACGLEFFDVEMGDSLCLDCRAVAPA